MYSHEALTLDEAYDALFSRKKMKHLVIRSEAQVEGLVVQGRIHKKNFSGVVGDKTFNYSKKKGHIISKSYKLHIRIREILNRKGSN